MSDLIGNPKDRFSHNEAQIISTIILSTTDTREVDELSVSAVKNVNLELDNCSMSMPRVSVVRPTDDSSYVPQVPNYLKTQIISIIVIHLNAHVRSGYMHLCHTEYGLLINRDFMAIYIYRKKMTLCFLFVV